MENYLEIIGKWMRPDRSLHNPEPIPYVFWWPGNETISLNGKFTSNELRALAHYMDPDGEDE